MLVFFKFKHSGVQDPKRTRQVYQSCLDLIPNKKTDAGWEEYYDYIFPEDAANQPKLLSMAHMWKKQQQQDQDQEKQEAEKDESTEPTQPRDEQEESRETQETIENVPDVRDDSDSSSSESESETKN
ncbi:hypothetical protein HF521_012252 [Silurus meridionalis]|uniref:Uncharacterized protein n=1 Tax=Silurus meridionalis TaxID=175797 RepID=A0A8T0AGL5_SILME|nr:hypothetical protein HF521_012252 [Silurus meridionalis]